MDEEEFMEWLDSLSPEEKDQALYEFGYAGANQVGPSFGGPFAPEMPMGGYDIAQIGGGVNVPELTTKGAVDPYDLTQMAKRINVGQDIATSYVDNALAMLGGPGAYDVSAFQDTVTGPAKRLALPGQARIDRYRSGGGYEAYLADAIGRRGLSPANAIAEMWQVIEQPDSEDVPQELRDMRESIVASLPSAEARGGLVPPSGGAYSGAPGREGRTGYDEKALWSVAQDMFDATLEDEMVRQTGWIDEAGEFGPAGAVYEGPPEVEPSTAAKWYRDRGLPLPTETYDSDKYINAVLDAQFPNREKANTERIAREQEAQLKATVLGAGEQKAERDERDLMKAYEDVLAQQREEADVITNRTNAANAAALSSLASSWDPNKPVPARGPRPGAAERQERGANAGALGNLASVWDAEMMRELGGQPGMMRNPAGTQGPMTTRENILAAAPPTGTPGPAFGVSRNRIGPTNPLTAYETIMYNGGREDTTTPMPFINVDKEGNVSPIYDFGGTNQENAGVQQATQGIGDLVAGLFGGGGRERDTSMRRMRESDRANLRRTTERMRKEARTARRELFNEQYRRDPTAMAEARALGQMYGLARAGRTPLQDAVAQRALVQRSMGMIG